ncbi:MAG: TIR domain-containing protein [Candidatus Poribacteria bacterium]|nr:TIR domain-containing protein [Candidatus Poribacteria bacterium]
MSDQIKNIFIPHIHEDDEGLVKLKELAANHGMQLRDSSITSDKPNNAKDEDYIKQEILNPQIEWAGTVVVYVSPDTWKSEWVNWEIERANELEKRIVGIWQYGEEDCKIPEALEEYGDAMVGWNGESIIDAITGESDDWYKQNGETKDYRPIKRHGC